MRKGFFITIEGGEGAGKTTVIQTLKEKLEQDGHQVITTREPGGITIAEKIRSVILDVSHTSMDGRTEALLYAAARRQHLVEKIIPALSSGVVVICDRFIDSSLAYQGHARGIGFSEVLSINEFALEGYWPDLTIYMDIPPEVGLKRIATDNEREVNRLDNETMKFHELVRAGYQKALTRYSKRMVLIDANQQVEKVIDDAMAIVMDRLRK